MAVEWPLKTVSNWFFRGSKYQDSLQKHFFEIQKDLNDVVRKLSDIFHTADIINEEGVKVLCHDCGKKKGVKQLRKDMFLCLKESELQGVRSPPMHTSRPQSIRGTNIDREGALNSLRSENERLKGQIQDLSSRLERSESENREMALQTTIQSSRNEWLEKEFEMQKSQIQELRSECADYKSKIESLQQDNWCLENEMSLMKERAKQSLVLSFHTNLKPTLALPAQQHLEQRLRERFEANGMSLQTRPYDPADPSPGPTLVLCMNVSRLGTDVKEAVKGTPENKEVVVVVLHHKEVHALPNQSSDRSLIGDDYRRLGAIVDAAFLTGRGMYDCDMNRQAVEKIIAFLQTFLPQK